MTAELPDDAYLRWLYSQVATARLRNPSRTYWNLIRELYTTEFVYFVPNDDNRAMDGIALRYIFIEDTGIQHINEEWLGMGCSMLEMFVGLSRRLAFEAEGQPRKWFWHLMRNIELNTLADDTTPFPKVYVDEVLDRVIWRRYEPSGRGGLFPLENAHQDQRQVELWYQLAAYLTQ